ncbi:hypothetical protein FOQG_16929 [Fusarium oxysporum f. sp. raphani 54005]|uniref:Uncharacterized protein n=2 Tax=Fusarium oxysporum TaxID=5507 RepID=X0B8C8_FUSOX|nr:hypothetical protein FOVG_16697 [Fusarium oxysporum f. sp. pisi HDV247]EXK78395.1 hypothetical protein FOQG_16929 [Fusarium oxysporum f. sp. raphani 54005]
MWPLSTVGTPKLTDALRKLGINDYTSESASTCTIRTSETIYYSARTSVKSSSLLDATYIGTTWTSATLDFIHILEEVHEALDASGSRSVGIQAIAEDSGIEGKIQRSPPQKGRRTRNRSLILLYP